MSKKIIPISMHSSNPAATLGANLQPAVGSLADIFARPLQDLRISVTDRCNFRCTYCMPKEVFDQHYPFLPQTALLSFEEITRLARLFTEHGVRKIRLTGGEPLLRKHLEKLVAMLSALQTSDGTPLDLTLTTNGALLVQQASALKQAGLKRLTVSLDALDEHTFRQMNDVDFPVAKVLHGIDAAHHAGLGPIKINMVVKRGVNEHQILPMAQHFKNSPHILRFIEYMDVGASNGWKMEQVVSSAEIVDRIHASMPLEQVAANYVGETATRWRYTDGSGEIGVISSVTHAFCQHCTRARLSTEGKLYTCLFATEGYDLRKLLRSGYNDLEVSNAIAQVWQARQDRYSELRASSKPDLAEGLKKVEMSYIGG